MIILTTTTNEKVWINPQYIIKLAWVKDHTRIIHTDGVVTLVKESPATISSLNH